MSRAAGGEGLCNEERGDLRVGEWVSEGGECSLGAKMVIDKRYAPPTGRGGRENAE